MSLPYGQQQLPPSLSSGRQDYTAHSDRGSIGPVIGALAVITVLLLISVMVGRLCSGRRVPGLGRYDFEDWFERKFASCIGARIEPPPPPRLPNANGTGGPPSVVIPVAAPPEAKQTHHQQPPPHLMAPMPS